MSDLNPTAYRRTAGSSTVATSGYPTGLVPTLYTKLDFYEYKRDIGANAERKHVGSIRLPIPTNLRDNTAVRTNDTDLGILGNATEFIARGSKIGEVGKQIGDQINSLKAESGVMGAAKIASMVPLSSDLGNLARSISGIVPNPHTTTIFSGVGLKPLSLQWRLSPRSQRDADELTRIIRYLKARILPTTESAAGMNYALNYPDLVKVSFVGTKDLEDYRFSFITNIGVGYGSGQSVSFFKDGSPIDTELNIELKEIDIRTREDYEAVSGTNP